MTWHIKGMTQDEIDMEVLEILTCLPKGDGLREGEIDLIMKTRKALEEDNFVKKGKESTYDERKFITDICREFMNNCTKMLWDEFAFSCEQMAKILKCSRDKVYPYHQKLRWKIKTRQPKRQSTWKMGDDGKIKFAGYSTQ